jgi:translation elongation factor EF-1beta
MQSMRRAFVVVNADLGSEDELQSELKKVEGVAGVYQVLAVGEISGVKPAETH